MTPNGFRRFALRLEGAEESSHMGYPDFRVGGNIFATRKSRAGLWLRSGAKALDHDFGPRVSSYPRNHSFDRFRKSPCRYPGCRGKRTISGRATCHLPLANYYLKLRLDGDKLSP